MFGTDEKDAPYIGKWDGGTAKKGGVGPNEHIDPDSGSQSGQKPTPQKQPISAKESASKPADVSSEVEALVPEQTATGKLRL
jgi:hypothetical protein